MRWMVLAMCVALVAGACVTAGRAPAPSKACGGFHIVIDNVGHAGVAVYLNDDLMTTVDPGDTVDIGQWGSYGAPHMPWDLALTRVTDHALLLAMHLEDDGSDGRRVKVGDTPVDQAAVTDYIC
jgi:hypothetical protein